MTTKTSWDPGKHPRGPLGRFIDVGQRGSFSPNPRLVGTQREVLFGDYSPDADRIGNAYSRGTFEGLAMNRLDASQRQVVSEYIYSSNINDSLRAGLSAEGTEELDSVIEGVRLKRDTLVYRGMRGGVLDGAQPGDQILDRGYLSTSMNPAIASDYGDDIVEIELPAGTNAAPVTKVNSYEYGGTDEVLVGRGSVLEIMSIEDAEFDRPALEGGRQRLIRARLVGYVED